MRDLGRQASCHCCTTREIFLGRRRTNEPFWGAALLRLLCFAVALRLTRTPLPYS